MSGQSKSLNQTDTSPSPHPAPIPASLLSSTDSKPNSEHIERLPLGVTHLPTGLVNDGNTCYLNSVFQSLIHTPPLTQLLVPADCPKLPWQPPTTIEIDRSRCPALMSDRNEHRDLMPLAATFIESSSRSWRTELKGVEPGTGERKGQGLKTLLYTMSKKYDQYGDYAQQDSHELLRHLLDSIRMEEVDVIMRLHPPAPKQSRRKTLPAVDTPATSASASIASIASIELNSPASSLSPSLASSAEAGAVASTIPVPFAPGTNEASLKSPAPHNMVSFIDLLFGGRLASMIVCETCKSVSHTYEDFMDLSMGLPTDEPRERKRDRLKSMASRFREKLTRTDNDSSDGHVDDSAIASDDEDTDDQPPSRKTSRRPTMESEVESVGGSTRTPGGRRSTVGENNGSGLGRRPSIFSGAFTNLRKRNSTSRRASAAHSDAGSGTNSRSGSPTLTDRIPRGSFSSGKSGQAMTGLSTLTEVRSGKTFPKVTPAQAAYISRILGSGLDPSRPDPLAALRLPGISSSLASWSASDAIQSTGLLDALRQFTAVEILEGENAFACKRCWRWENPRPDGRPWRRGGESGNNADDEEEDAEEEALERARVANVATAEAGTSGAEPVAASLSQLQLNGGSSPAEAILPDSTISSAAPSFLELPTLPEVPLPESASFTEASIQPASPVLPSEAQDMSVEQSVFSGPSQQTAAAEEQQQHCVVPVIQTTPFSPITEVPNPIPEVSKANDGLKANYDATLHVPTNKRTIRPDTARGRSFTRHHNPTFADGVVSDSDASSVSSYEPSTDDEASSVGTGEGSTNAGSSEGAIPFASSARPKPTRQKSTHFVMRKAFKRYLIVNPPPILVFHLKRFEQITGGRGFNPFGGFTGNFKKIDSYISFPLTVDIAPFLAPARVGAPITPYNAPVKRRAGKAVLEQVLYQLCAIVVHIGVMDGGHYVSYVLSSPDAPPGNHDPTSTIPPTAVPVTPTKPTDGNNTNGAEATEETKDKDPRVWWYCSDTLVRPVQVEDVLKAKAYLLFYDRI